MAKITALSVLTYRLEVREPGRAACTLGKVEGNRAHAMEVAYDRYEAIAIAQGDRPLVRSKVEITVIPKCGICGRDNRGPWDICEKCDEPTVKDGIAYLDNLDALDSQVCTECGQDRALGSTLCQGCLDDQDDIDNNDPSDLIPIDETEEPK